MDTEQIDWQAQICGIAANYRAAAPQHEEHAQAVEENANFLIMNSDQLADEMMDAIRQHGSDAANVLTQCATAFENHAAALRHMAHFLRTRATQGDDVEAG